jgi:phytoene dehydrogenase-like protein
MQSYDAIIIGAGVNGLACASRLAGKSRKVLLLESASNAGGGAGNVEFAPGYHAPALAHSTQSLDPRVLSGMRLTEHGLSFHPALSSTVLSPSGDHLVVAGGATSGADAAAFAALHQKLSNFARVLAPFRTITPPRLTNKGNEWSKLGRYGLGIRALGKADFREFLRMILINIYDVAQDELTDERLKGLLAFDTTLGSWLGPRSPNSLILYLNRLAMGAQSLLPRGGMGALANAMAKAASASGVELRANSPVAKLLIDADRAVGVKLASGEEIRAKLVVSAINPRTTFQKLVGPRDLDAGFFTKTGHIRSRGTAAKLTLALTAAPDFRGADLKSRLVIAPSAEAVELAFNPVKYGEVPASPVMEIIHPTAHEVGMAPAGHHVLSAVVQYAPHSPKAGVDAARAEMLENTLSQLETHAPGIGKLIAHSDLLMPQDIEMRFGMVGGNWHHGELAVEQMLFNRPLREAAQYATPLPGLYLAGAGSHPGGGINGAAGWNAAERILAEVQP